MEKLRHNQSRNMSSIRRMNSKRILFGYARKNWMVTKAMKAMKATKHNPKDVMLAKLLESGTFSWTTKADRARADQVAQIYLFKRLFGIEVKYNSETGQIMDKDYVSPPRKRPADLAQVLNAMCSKRTTN